MGNSSTDPVVQKKENCSEFYKHFAKESPLCPGDHGVPFEQVNLSISSDLNNPELLDQGREFTRRNYISVLLCHFIMMMFGLASRYGRIVIYHTGESLTRSKARRRDLSTIVRIVNWLEGDIVVATENNNIAGSRDLQIVRKIHLLAAKTHFMRPKPSLPPLTELQTQVLEAIRKETEHVDLSGAPDWILRDDPEFPLSQFPMSAGQWGFMGLLVLMPEVFGMTDRTGLDGYVHQWAIIGRHLGIEDRFNWGLHYKKTGDVTAFREMLEKVILPTVKTIDEAGIIMWQAMVDGVKAYFVLFRFLPVVKFTLNCCGLKGQSMDPLLDWKDKVCYWLLTWGLYTLGRYEFGKQLVNFYLRTCIGYGAKKYLVKRKESKRG